MLETVDLEAKLSKREHEEVFERLDLELAKLQRDIKDAGIPVLVVFEGWDASGKGTVLSRLLQPLDPRGFSVHAINPPSPQEQRFPAMRRFWLRQPPAGHFALYDRSWYRQVLDERIEHDLDAPAVEAGFERIRVFERQLADNGAVVVKFFLHISKKEQAKRLKALSKDPAYAWRAGKAERKRHKQYANYLVATEDMLRETSTAYAPWTLVPATDQRFAEVKVAETLAAALAHALARPPDSASEPPAVTRRTSPLDAVDLGLSVDKADYNKDLPKLQARVRALQGLGYQKGLSTAIVYEGWDAAGKGGNIRRLVREMDPRGYEVAPFAAPDGIERAHHYLWRFWRALPRSGHVTIFDRSWYGRVLVERVEGFATPQEWARAYREINEFEEQLAEFGMVLVKFWIHIGKDEQLNRFEARQNTPHKQHKITEEDWRNREKWHDYHLAVSDMIERTSTLHAPWTILEGNDKRHARLKALRIVCTRLETALDTN